MAARPTWESICETLTELPGTEFDPGKVVFPNGVVRVKGKVVAYPAGGDRGTPPDATPGEKFIFIKASASDREALLQQDPNHWVGESHGSRFDACYEQMADDELRHALAGKCLGLPPRLKVTGLLPSRVERALIMPHIQRFLASAVR